MNLRVVEGDLKEWTPADLRTVGYFAKQARPRPEWLHAPRVEWVCSVSNCGCCAGSPAGWIDHWLHNAFWVFDSLPLLERVLPPGEAAAFLRYGLRTLPVEFHLDADTGIVVERALDLAPTRPEPIPAHFVRLGYDLCARSTGHDLESSPLSCNYCAAETPTNRWCLIDSFIDAVKVAREFARREPEPGPYVLIEVWADRTPDRPPV